MKRDEMLKVSELFDSLKLDEKGYCLQLERHGLDTPINVAACKVTDANLAKTADDIAKYLVVNKRRVEAAINELGWSLCGRSLDGAVITAQEMEIRTAITANLRNALEWHALTYWVKKTNRTTIPFELWDKIVLLSCDKGVTLNSFRKLVDDYILESYNMRIL